jgi:plasmid stability protein
MTALYVRRVPEPVAEALRERARRHGHSLQQEVLEILKVAAATPLPGEALPPLQIKTVQTNRTSTWSRDEIYGDQGR